MNSPSRGAAGRLVLGSSSRYRAELLGRLGVPFEQQAPELDERQFDALFDELPTDEFALHLARAKAESLRRRGGDRWLLCADQVGVLDLPGKRTMLSKPGTHLRCVEQLMTLSGRVHELVNGIVLMDESSGEFLSAVDIQVMTMREFGREEAERYVAECEPLDCAGGYRIEDAGIRLFESIDSSDYTGIIGLPLLCTAELLRDAGLLRP